MLRVEMPDSANALILRAVGFDMRIAFGVFVMVAIVVLALHGGGRAPLHAAPQCPVGFNVQEECRHFDLAVELEGRGRYSEAKQEYGRALCLDPEDEVARYRMSRLPRRKGK